ncbi:MAG TPA: hypothetical protein VFD36_20565 [Kofleriaceae bacterium]|nr:hypothetical protein [Kofleriaceae bacterium]
MTTPKPPYVTSGPNGEIILVDPEAVAICVAVERENIRRFLVDTQLDRIRHFEDRIAARGDNGTQWLIIAVNVDDSNGGAVADMLMPGHDWDAIRATGQQPWARGLASRRMFQGMLDDSMPIEGAVAAGLRLREVDGIAVLAIDRGIVAVFAATELV